MISNIIFDMGNVILSFDPDRILAHFVSSEENRALIKKELFDGPEWPQLDAGTIEEDVMLTQVLARLPLSAQDDARKVMEHWHEELPVCDEMYHLIRELKQKGYGIYLVSNAGVRFRVYEKNVPAFKLMNGMIVSAEVKSVKPQKEIYEKLFFTYYLNPAQCVFIDDIPANIEGGKAVGMDGIVFDGNVNTLREELCKREVDVEICKQIIPVTNDDEILELSRLAHEIWNQHFVPIIGQAQVNYMLATFQSRSALTRLIREDGYRYYFLNYDGMRAGYTGFLVNGKELFLSKLYLRESVRGNKIAKATMDFLASVAQNQGCEKISLTVNRYNSDTIAAYEKMGFVTVREQAADIGEGFVMDDFIMEKSV